MTITIATTSQATKLDKSGRAQREFAGGLGTLAKKMQDAGTLVTTMPTGSTYGTGYLVYYTFAPANAGAALVHASITQPTSGTTTVTTGFSAITFPRLVSVTGNQATCTGNLVLTGTDIEGVVISDTLVINGTATVNSVKSFKTISQAVVPTRGAASDAITIGTVNTFGLPIRLSNTAQVIAGSFYGTVDTGFTVSVDATDISKNLYVTAGTPNGTKILWIAMMGM